MFDIYVTVGYKTPEVTILYGDVLLVKLYLQRNLECGCPLIVLVNCDWIFEKTSQYRLGVSLKLKYELNFLHKTHKS